MQEQTMSDARVRFFFLVTAAAMVAMSAAGGLFLFGSALIR